jgi:PBP1b-binding outer membrane lipoprotein LpoB
MKIVAGFVASLFGSLLLSGCASGAPAPTVITVTAPQTTASPARSGSAFNPATSGKLLAGKVATRAQTAGVKVSKVECRNFPNIKVGTHVDCQMIVNGVKQGVRATFEQRDGHYVLKPQKLTW